MTPGTIFIDQNFIFHDGDIGNKILISLGYKSGVTVVVKATSKGHRYNAKFGCQALDRFPNFHLVQNCCVLSKPTWICLNEFYEFNVGKLIQKHFDGAIKQIGKLSDAITVDLIACALDADDITPNQIEILKHIMD
jgi:hypothetical protein